MSEVLPYQRATESAKPKKRRKLPRLAVDAKRLAVMLCCGVRTIRTHDAAGKLPAPIRVGGRVLWRVAEIRAWLDAGAPDRAAWERIRSAQPKLPAR
jgi:predicted DNA-binding transcriptional regulator AlpA